MPEKKLENPYHVLGEQFVQSVMGGNRGKITGNQEGVADRLRRYSYYVTENMVDAGDALLANDLLDVARNLARREDPTLDERWNAGVDFAMKQLCAALDVDPNSVTWDAATETVDGDVQAVVWNILCARFGEDWEPPAPLSDTCPNCKGTRRATYFSELAMAHEERDRHICRPLSDTHRPEGER